MYFNLDQIKIKIISQEKYSDKIIFEYNNKKYYYKKVKRIATLYNELIAAKIASKINIPCCKYFLAEYDNELGIVSEYFEEINSISIEEYLKTKYSTNIAQRNNLKDIYNAFLLDFSPATLKRLEEELINIFLFDVIIGNSDRNISNLKIILDNDDTRFAPLYDNENLLSEYAIYDGEYCLGIDEKDYFNEEHNNILYKFLDQCDLSYHEKLKKYLNFITQEQIEEIFWELEKENIKINSSIKNSIKSKFAINRNMIESYFQKKLKIK